MLKHNFLTSSGLSARVTCVALSGLGLLSLALSACGNSDSESDSDPALTAPSATDSTMAAATTGSATSASVAPSVDSMPPAQSSTAVTPTPPEPTNTGAQSEPPQPSVSQTVTPQPSAGPSAGPTGGMGGAGEQGDTGGSAGAGGDAPGPASSSDQGMAGAGGSDPVDPASPETFYMTVCATCHGSEGQGVDGLGPDIAHPVRDYSTWVVRNGREGGELYPGGMMVYDESVLSDEVLEGILDYLADQPQPTTGEALYADYCAACHGADGGGGPTGRPVVNEAGKVNELVRGGHHPGEFDVRREFMPKWSAEELSDAELQLISDYIESL